MTIILNLWISCIITCFFKGLIFKMKKKWMYFPNRIKMPTVIIYCYIDFFFLWENVSIAKWKDLMMEPTIGIWMCLILILSIFSMTYSPSTPKSGNKLTFCWEKSLLLVLKRKYSRMYGVCCQWNADHPCKHWFHNS